MIIVTSDHERAFISHERWYPLDQTRLKDPSRYLYTWFTAAPTLIAIR